MELFDLHEDTQDEQTGVCAGVSAQGSAQEHPGVCAQERPATIAIDFSKTQVVTPQEETIAGVSAQKRPVRELHRERSTFNDNVQRSSREFLKTKTSKNVEHSNVIARWEAVRIDRFEVQLDFAINAIGEEQFGSGDGVVWPWMIGLFCFLSTGEGLSEADLCDGIEGLENHARSIPRMLPAVIKANRAEGLAPLDQDLIVRPIGTHKKGQARFELVDGERRWRAAQIAMLEEVSCDVRQLTDEEADNVAINSFLLKQGLTAIEEAQMYERYLDTHQITQEQLAEVVNRSQGHIANALRLLKLPKVWRDLIISQKITAKHARVVLPFVQFSEIDKELLDRVKQDRVGPVADWKEEVEDVVGWKAERLGDKVWSSKSGKQISPFKPTDEEREQLRIVATDDRNGKPREYATNVKLFKQLQAVHQKKIEARLKNGKSSSKAGAANKGKVKLTPAAEKAKAKEQAAQFAKRLFHWKCNWLRRLIRDRLVDDAENFDTLVALKLLFFVAVNEGVFGEHNIHYTRGDIFHRVASRLQGRKLPSINSYGATRSVNVWNCLDGANDEASLAVLASEMFAEYLWTEKSGPGPMLHDKVVLDVAADLGIVLKKSWAAQNRDDPLRQEYFELHTKDQLEALGKELKVHLFGSNTKSSMIKKLSTGPKKLALPREIDTVKPPKA